MSAPDTSEAGTNVNVKTAEVRLLSGHLGIIEILKILDFPSPFVTLGQQLGHCSAISNIQGEENLISKMHALETKANSTILVSNM